MLSQNPELQSLDRTETGLSVTSVLADAEDTSLDTTLGTPTKFYGRYNDSMKMYAPAKVVAEYLGSHASWFPRCAEPMKAQPLGENGYALVIGRFGSLGYEVEPKVGLELLPPEAGVYRIRTIPIPDYQAPGYDVDYQASLELLESSVNDSFGSVTQVEWELDLTVIVYLPKFIYKLPKSLIQSAGDRLLNQVVRQVSRRLTRKVQEDFHRSFNIEFPANFKKKH